MILDHVGCQNNCFWPVLALRKPQIALKMGLFGTKNGSKKGVYIVIRAIFFLR